jgi:hypothetical protein
VHWAAREPAHLFEIAAAGEPADPNSGPTQFRHQLGQAPLGAGTPSPLRNLLHVKRHLCGHSLQPIITHLTVQPFQGGSQGRRATNSTLARSSFSRNDKARIPSFDTASIAV